MAVTTTTGLVQRVTWAGASVCVLVGPSIASSSAFFVLFQPPDNADIRGFKRNVVTLLTRALLAGYPVSVTHDDATGEMQEVAAGAFDICPVGRAIHHDFYSITGAGIPADAEVVFDSATATVTFAADMVRPHWVFVSELPDAIPLGRNMVRLQNAAGWASDWVPVDVVPGSSEVVRTLYGGDPKEYPYTIVFVATPGIATDGGVFEPDPILANRPDYHHAVKVALKNLLMLPEDVLWQGDQDRQIRFVSVFDPTLPADDFNSLANGDPPNILDVRQDRLNDFLDRYGIAADLVFVVSGHDTYTRESAALTLDLATGLPSGLSYTYDGAVYRHEPFAEKPGGATLGAPGSETRMVALHEFLHAASEKTFGRVNDLYRDGAPGQGNDLVINKKHRAQSTDPIPPLFVNYNGTDFPSDGTRDGLGYPPDWTSYHAELIDPAYPNVMDGPALVPGGSQLSRLDRVTHAWYTDRLRVKLNR